MDINNLPRTNPAARTFWTLEYTRACTAAGHGSIWVDVAAGQIVHIIDYMFVSTVAVDMEISVEATTLQRGFTHDITAGTVASAPQGTANSATSSTLRGSEGGIWLMPWHALHFYTPSPGSAYELNLGIIAEIYGVKTVPTIGDAGKTGTWSAANVIKNDLVRV